MIEAPPAGAVRATPGPPGGGAVILGGGLAGLSAAYGLSLAGRSALVLEQAPRLGGLARTVEADGFRFDLGGHRFLAADPEVMSLVRYLLGPDLISVPRRSTILRSGRHYHYPLRPLNALAGVGPRQAAGMIASWGLEQARAGLGRPAAQTFEQWVVGRFGRALFRRFFREYSEKVWGLPCGDLSAELAAKRIGPLSLGRAMGRAWRPRPGAGDTDEAFWYPRRGIGMIADRLAAAIMAQGGQVRCASRVEAVLHERGRVRAVRLAGQPALEVEGAEFLSTIPVGVLASLLRPLPPAHVRQAATSLRYRDLVVVALFLDCPRLTEQTWIYLPDADIPFGRLHEPVNWSPEMAPRGRTVLVAEYFCFAGDATWNADDQKLAELTSHHLARLGLIRPGQVLGSRVVRAPQAYPIPSLGYQGHLRLLGDYLAGLTNLRLLGRTGGFRYLNMDEVLRDGLDAARELAGTREAVGKGMRA